MEEALNLCKYGRSSRSTRRGYDFGMCYEVECERERERERERESEREREREREREAEGYGLMGSHSQKTPNFS
jgi:hypothetical protein